MPFFFFFYSHLKKTHPHPNPIITLKHYIYHQKPTTTKKRFGAKSANSIWREKKKEKKRVTVREREKTHETNHANEFFFSLSGCESQNSISLPLYPFVFFFFCSRFSLSHSILGLLRIGFFFFYRKCNVFKLLLCVSEFFFIFSTVNLNGKG